MISLCNRLKLKIGDIYCYIGVWLMLFFIQRVTVSAEQALMSFLAKKKLTLTKIIHIIMGYIQTS